MNRPSPSEKPYNNVLAPRRHLFLRRALRAVVEADSDPARQALFANLMQASLPVRVAYRLHGWMAGTWTAALLVSCYGVKAFLTIVPPRHVQARVLTVARHANARRLVARVTGWIGDNDCTSVDTRAKAAFGTAGLGTAMALATGGRVLRTLRILRAIDGRHGFLVSCRAAALLAWYARTKAILGAHRPGAVLVSSDSNPEELGFLAAARALGIPQVFVAHAYPTPMSPPLDFTLSILEGEAAVQARRKRGPVNGRVLLIGIEGDSAPLDVSRFERRHPVVGIFTPKALSWPALAATIRECREHLGAKQVIIRWHPSMLERVRLPDVLDDLTGVIQSPRSATLEEVAQQCDWVVAAVNSNVHLHVLKLGIPTIAIKNLGLYPDSRSDLYGFVANGIVFPPVESIREVRAEALHQFFSDGWRARFERYDVSYLRPQPAIASEVRRAVFELFERSNVMAASA